MPCDASHCEASQLTRELCENLAGDSVSKYSLKLQIWWRDHQIHDAEREKQEAKNKLQSSIVNTNGKGIDC